MGDWRSGSAIRLHRKGREFESLITHQNKSYKYFITNLFFKEEFLLKIIVIEIGFLNSTFS